MFLKLDADNDGMLSRAEFIDTLCNERTEPADIGQITAHASAAAAAEDDSDQPRRRCLDTIAHNYSHRYSQ